MENAYSIEFRRIIDAEKAYEMFWEGIVKDKHAFTCPEPGCNAQITCSSISKERRMLKQVPHFRCYGEHKKNCPYDEKRLLVNQQEDGQEKKDNPIIDAQIDILLLERDKKEIETIKDVTDKVIDHDHIKRSLINETLTGGIRNSEYVTIMPLVSKYYKYLEDKTLAEHFIQNQGKNISYNDMFINSDGKEFSWLSSYYRIYFGKAIIKPVRNKVSDFRIMFTQGLKYNGVGCSPSAYVSSTIIENSYRNKKWLNELTELQNTGEEVMVFIYGKVRFTREEDKIKYCNIDIAKAKLDFIDIRHIE